MNEAINLSDELAGVAAPGAREVHLWQAALDVSPQRTATLAATLSAAENRRAARLRRPDDRARYIAAHGWLRRLLAHYLDADPAALAFKSTAHGKPRLADPTLRWLHVNLSHSAARAAFAVTRNRDVGVDIEQVRDDVDIDGIAHRYFTNHQRAALAAMAHAERTRAFFAHWTRHEALLKAAGSGLAGARHKSSHAGCDCMRHLRQRARLRRRRRGAR